MATTQIQLRGDSASNWTSANPVLADREIGLETDTKKLKIGNGSLSWNSLDYFVETPILTGGTNVNITNDYEINLDSNININTLTATTVSVNSGGSAIFRSSGFRNTFGTTTLSNDRTIVLPDKSGTVAMTTDIPSIPTTFPYDLVVAASDELSQITSGTSKITFISPAAFTLSEVTASLTTSGSTTTTIDVNYNGSSVFATPISLASGIFYGTTATTTTSIARYGRFTVDFDAVGTGAAGVKVTLSGTRTL